MRTTTLAILSYLSIFTGCATVQLVAPYDEEILSGVTDYKELLNKHVKDMGVLNGTQAGSYSANRIKYNELEVKIDLLVDRARLQSVSSSCMLPGALANAIRNHLQNDIPATLQAAPGGSSAENGYGCIAMMLGNVREQLDLLQQIHEAESCPLRGPDAALTQFPTASENNDIQAVVDEALDEVWGNLRETIRDTVIARIEETYQIAEGNAPAAEDTREETVSCLRIPAAQDSLDIMNQAINAVWVLENAKKN